MSFAAIDRQDWRFSLRLALGVGGFFAVAVFAVYVSAGAMLDRALKQEEAALLLDRREDVRLAWLNGGEQGVVDLLAEVEATTGEHLAVKAEDSHQTMFFHASTSAAPLAPWPELRLSHSGAQKQVVGFEGWTATEVLLSPDETIHVARFSSTLADVRHTYRGVIATVVAPLLMGGLLGGFLLVMAALRPLRRTVDVMRHIVQTGDWAARVAVPSQAGEMRNLAQAFNAVLERQQRLILSLRQSLDHVAHDLRTPLTRLRMTVEAGLEKAGEDSPARAFILDSLTETERLQATLNTLLDVAEVDAGAIKLNTGPIDAATLLEEVAELYEFAAEEKGAFPLIF